MDGARLAPRMAGVASLGLVLFLGARGGEQGQWQDGGCEPDNHANKHKKDG